MVLESECQMTSHFVGLPCCLTIICDNAFLPTPAKYECQAPKIWVPRDQPVSGCLRYPRYGEDPENQAVRVGSIMVIKEMDRRLGTSLLKRSCDS